MEAIVQPTQLGPPGKPRSIGVSILLFIVTLGFYGWYWTFKTHDEIKVHSNQGVGGVLGLVIYLVISPVTAFILPSEIGKMHQLRGRQSPVTGWTGLWLIPFGILLIPAIVWFVKVQGALNRYWAAEGA
jgi:hypothetical protein